MKKIPHLQSRISGGGVAWYWVPSARLKGLGYKLMALGKDQATASQLARRQNDDIQRQMSSRTLVASDTVTSVIHAYRADEEFAELAERTKRSYDQNLGIIERWAGDQSIRAITPQAVKAFKRSMKDTPSKANAVLGMLRILMSFAFREGLVQHNPASKFKRYPVTPRTQIWTDEAEAAFFAKADEVGAPSLKVALALSLYTGQRETDVLTLRWAQVKGGYLVLTQSKTGVSISVPVLSPLARVLDDVQRTSLFIVTSEATGLPYKPDAFCHRVGDLIASIGLAGAVQFRDARRTAVVRMHKAGLNLPEISAWTGHSFDSTMRIAQTYLPRGHRITPTTVARLEEFYAKG